MARAATSAHCVARRGDDNEIRRTWQIGNLFDARQTINRLMARIDELDRARKTTLPQIAEYSMAERARPRTGTNQGKAGGFDQTIKAADGHERILRDQPDPSAAKCHFLCDAAMTVES